MKKSSNPLLAFLCALLGLGAASLHGQTLPTTNGLLLWLNADVGVATNAVGAVTTWSDQSGLGNDATNLIGSGPFLVTHSLNGHATLRCNGTNFLAVPSANGIDNLLNDVTIICVAKFDQLLSYQMVFSKVGGSVSGNHYATPIDMYGNPANTPFTGAVGFSLANGNGMNVIFQPIFPPPAGFYFAMGFRYVNGFFDMWQDDQRPLVATPYNVTPNDGGFPLTIGRRSDNVSSCTGNIAEILIYQPSLSDAQMAETISNYLQPKYALTYAPDPIISITNPTNGAFFAAPASVPVNISASAPGAAISSVAVYGNGALLGKATIPPFNLTVNVTTPGLLALTAVATSTNYTQTTSAPVNVIITGATPALPPNTSALGVWLEANAGVMADNSGDVTNWVDQSGNGNNATQVTPSQAPTLATNVANGQPVLRFNGASQFLQVPDGVTASFATNFSTFAVARFNDFPSFHNQVIWAKTSSGAAAPVDWSFTNTGVASLRYGFCNCNGNAAIVNNTGASQVYLGAGPGSTAGPVTGTAVLQGQFVDFGFSITNNGTANLVSNFFDFTTAGTGNLTASPASLGEPMQIGQRDDDATQLNGDLAEILIYNQPLSATDRSNAVAYLNGKYGIIAPVFGNPPPVVAVTLPTNNSSIVAPAIVTFGATASSSDSSIGKVTLIANGITIATLTNAPYQVPIELQSPGAVKLTAIAQDNWGLLTTSAPVSVTVTESSVSAALAVTNGLKLWLAADVGVQTDAFGDVTNWLDQSPDMNNATPTNATTAPILMASGQNGKPIVTFNGGLQFLQVTGDNNMAFMTGNISAFYVASFSNYTTYRDVLGKVGANGYPAPVEQFYYTGTGLPYLAVGHGTGAQESLVISTGNAVPAGIFCALGFTINGSRGTNYFDYSITGSGALTIPEVDGGTPLRIGRRQDNVVIMDGGVAEILIYNRAVSDSERIQILNYLLGKWGIPVVQLANTPPTVTLTTPTNGATVSAPGLLSVVASATEPANAITKVNFLVNGVVAASLTAPPYQIPLEVLSPGPLTLQATAVDYFGATGQSAVIQVTGTGSVQSPPPPPTNGLAIWLGADVGVTTNSDGTVASWADQTTNGNNAIGNDPGAPSLIMDTNIQRLVLAFSTNSLQVPYSLTEDCPSDMSMFYTAEFTAPFTGANTICSETVQSFAYQFDYNVSGTAATATRGGGPSGFTAIVSAGPFPAGQYLVGGYTVTGDTCIHYLNNAFYGTGILYPGNDLNLPMEIGMRADSANPLTGNLGDVLVYDRVLGADEVQAVNAYLAARYNVAFTQISTQPPILSVLETGASTVQLSWPPGYANYVLQSNTNLTTTTWTPLATNPVNNQVSVTANKGAQFFRLIQGH